MNPDSFILIEVLNQGVQWMRAFGYTQFSTTCEKVRTASEERLVSALNAVGSDGAVFLMFFSEQVITKKGGSAKYFVTSKNADVTDITQPLAYEIENDEDAFFRWRN